MIITYNKKELILLLLPQFTSLKLHNDVNKSQFKKGTFIERSVNHAGKKIILIFFY